MIYLSKVKFPTAEREADFFFSQKMTCYDSFYPFQILTQHRFEQIDFEPITVLYGGNGSGKTTALKIYDLDEDRVDVKKWTELDNVQAYYDFFKKHKAEFEK